MTADTFSAALVLHSVLGSSSSSSSNSKSKINAEEHLLQALATWGLHYLKILRLLLMVLLVFGKAFISQYLFVQFQHFFLVSFSLCIAYWPGVLCSIHICLGRVYLHVESGKVMHVLEAIAYTMLHLYMLVLRVWLCHTSYMHLQMVMPIYTFIVDFFPCISNYQSGISNCECRREVFKCRLVICTMWLVRFEVFTLVCTEGAVSASGIWHFHRMTYLTRYITIKSMQIWWHFCTA